ncbi:MAG: ribonuclease R [Coriobacteriia bacterium]|nr:ribonuclease R [Coriobacteriia bacterium]MBN2840070.1 ribonuclease R [Coriobacteriia bacterium]
MRPDKLVLKTLRAAGRALDAEGVAGALEIAGGPGLGVERVAHTLAQLEKSGLVADVGGKYLALRERHLVVGRLSMNRRGFGFVSSPVGDIYVGKRDTGGAMHGDIVGVRVDPRGSHLGRSGEVVQILERAITEVVGRFERHGALGIVVPTDQRIRGDLFVDLKKSDVTVRPGEIVVARITRYADKRDAMQGMIVEVLGPEGAPGVDVEIVIREHGLATEFPPEVIEAAEQLRQDIDGELERGRRDLRERFTFTIDPADARDFDDAISIVREGKGYRLWVHIADVSHYVPWDSPVDVEARHRATSVYLVDRVLPMLPEHLSNVICSLNPGEDRLTFTVEMLLDKTGIVERYECYPSVIKSDRRFDYDQVQGWLDGGGYPDDVSRQALIDFRSVAQVIHERRVARGGLDFDTVEARVTLDERGEPIDVVLRSRTEATNMIEEAMIAANEVVARHMTAAKAPMVYRIHEDPDADALAQVAVVLKEFGYPVKDLHGASPATFQKIVAFAHGRPEERLINSLVLRALERARYVDYLGPHFGLASQAYTHFTSPIRRYPDLIVHRLLKAQLTHDLGKPPTSHMVTELEWLAEHSSTMEREAEAAESESQKVKLVALMAHHLGEEFDGIVTGVMGFGLFVQLENTAEGLVHVETMADDYYRLDAERFLLRGESNGTTYRLGQQVRVRILDASVSERRLDLELA